MVRVPFFVALALALGYAVLAIWRRRSSAARNGKDGFRPRVGFTKLDGMAAVALLLANESGTNIWVEEIEVFLTDLMAKDQTSEPACRGVQKIRQMVVPGDALPISLAPVIYKAAGEPQRRYSSVLSSVVRCRFGEKWIERHLEDYRIEMNGLTASKVKWERKSIPHFAMQAAERPTDVSAIAARWK